MFVKVPCIVIVYHQEAATNPLCDKLQLKDLLMFEVSRLVKYPLLIDSLLKHTQRKSIYYLAPAIDDKVLFLFVLVCLFVCLFCLFCFVS